MSKMLRVGIIGANGRSGWARESHVPAVQALSGLSLAAVATNSPDTAREAARAFGIEKGYGSGLDLIRDPDIDIVTVATRVPDHRPLVRAAIAAGKHVYSEWPLGAGPEEAREMADAARDAGVHTAIGLQLRESPAVRRAAELLASGAIGRLLSVSAFSSTAGFGPDVPAPFAYLEEPANFANLVTIQGAHTLDLLIALLGWPAEHRPLLSRQFPDIRVGEAQEARRRTTFDHLLVQGRFEADIPFALEVAGGRAAETPFRLELVGERGRLDFGGGAARGLQSGRLTLALNGSPVVLEEGEPSGLPDTALNVAGIYARLRDDILQGRHSVTGFGHAERLTRVIDVMLAGAA
jgi:predicted dehydrogenase